MASGREGSALMDTWTSERIRLFPRSFSPCDRSGPRRDRSPQAAIAGTRKEPDRYGVREIKWVAKLPVAKLQKQSEDLAKQIRELNVEIQQANWKAVLAG